MVSIATALLLSLPYLFGALAAPDDLVYTHMIMNPEDSHTYWAKMTQGYQGAWAYAIPFTTEPHEAAYVGIFYVWLGQLARMAGLSLTTIWHLSRLLAGLVLFLTLYWFIGLFISEPEGKPTGPAINGRRAAFLLAIFGSGLGWVLFLFQQPFWLDTFPVDFKQPGAHLFFTAMTFPHITIGTACIMASIGMMTKIAKNPESKNLNLDKQTIPGERAEKNTKFLRLPDLKASLIGEWQWIMLFGLSNLVLGIAYPFLIYIVAGTAFFFTIYLVWKNRAVPWQFGLKTGIAFLIPAPLYLYYVRVLQNNAVFKAWDVQAVTPSAPWPHYLIAFGPYLVLAILVVWAKRPLDQNLALLLCWLLTVGLLLYAPLNPQRRFVQGVHIPLSILSTIALTHIILPRWVQTRWWQSIVARPRYETGKLARLIVVIFLLMMSLSNIYLWFDITRTAVLVQPDPLFRTSDEAAAAAWLSQEDESITAVLGTMQSGNLIAARTGKPVFIGHWAETVAYPTKQAQVETFFQSDTAAAWRQQFLSSNTISHVWIGPREKALGSFNPEDDQFLTPVYQNSTITIYKSADTS